MTSRITVRKLVTFAAVGIPAYFGIDFFAGEQEAKTTILKGVLSAVIGGVTALIIPTKEKQAVEDPPVPPRSADGVLVATSQNETHALYQRMIEELGKWQVYGSEAEKYMASLEEARRQLDTRQTLLRISLFTIIALSFALSLTGFAAPRIPLEARGQTPMALATLLPSLMVPLIPFAVVGLIVGAFVLLVRVHTTGYHAFRHALMASSTVNLVSLLISLPYVLQRMWEEVVIAGKIEMPLFVWFAVTRLIAAPLVCACCAYLGFQFSKSLRTREA